MQLTVSLPSPWVCCGAGETPLTCASYCGHYAAVKALLEVGNVDVNLTRQDGTTPLNLAAYADAKTALLLLDYGARPDANTSKSSPFPVPLVMSAARGDVELCTRLIQVSVTQRVRPLALSSHLHKLTACAPSGQVSSQAACSMLWACCSVAKGSGYGTWMAYVVIGSTCNKCCSCNSAREVLTGQ
jgi:ankyrin repeat protein